MAFKHGSNVPVGSLRRLMQRPARPVAAPEHCDLCQEVIARDHRHLLDLSSRALLCTCTACFLLFSKEGAGGGKYRVVPRRFLALPHFQMSDGEWDDLMIPVNMVFMYRSTGSELLESSWERRSIAATESASDQFTNGRSEAGALSASQALSVTQLKGKQVSAFYPGPAGATESLLNLENWELLVQHNPILQTLEVEVEALLIYRVRGVREYYVVPIDVCYELVGLIRRSWRGLSGGEAVWKYIADFFAGIRAQAEPVMDTEGGVDARAEL